MFLGEFAFDAKLRQHEGNDQDAKKHDAAHHEEHSDVVAAA